MALALAQNGHFFSIRHVVVPGLHRLALAVCLLVTACSRMDSRSVQYDRQAPWEAIDECAVPHADWIFCSSFEEAHSPWFEEYQTDNRLVDPGPGSRADNHVGRTRVKPGRGGAGFVANVAAHRKLYLRYYVKWEPGFVLTDAHHGPGGLMADVGGHFGQSGRRPTGEDFISAGVEADVKPPFPLYLYTYYHGMYQDCPPLDVVNPPPESCFGDTLPCISDKLGVTYYCKKLAHRATYLQGVIPGRWYCVEEAADAGTPTSTASEADGTLTLWLDGRRLGHFDHLWMRTRDTLAFNVLWLYLFFHGEHGDRGLLFDDVVVSKSRVGCQAS